MNTEQIVSKVMNIINSCNTKDQLYNVESWVWNIDYKESNWFMATAIRIDINDKIQEKLQELR